MQLHKACTKARASFMPMHNRCNEIKNKRLHLSALHACSKGDNRGDTLQLHKACTKARASFMPMHNRRYVINNKTPHLSAVTHAAKATTEETHCSCTRHVPRHACLVHAHAQPALYNQQQNTTFISNHACSKGDDTGDTLLAAQGTYQGACLVHARAEPALCNQQQEHYHLSTVTHAAEAMREETHCSCTRQVPRRLPRSMPVHQLA